MANEVLIDPIATSSPDGRITIRDSDRSKARAIEAAGEFTGEAISGYQQGRALRAIDEETESFQAIAGAKSLGGKYDKDLGIYSFPENADYDKVQKISEQIGKVRKRAEKEFKEIALATEQGVYHGAMQARLEIERRIRNLSSQTPGFSEEIRRTAASVLGYDPTGWAIRQILDVDKPEEAEVEETKWVKRRREIRDGLSISRQAGGSTLSDEALDQEATRLTNIEIQNELISSRVAAGDLSADAATTKLLSTTPLESLWGIVQRKYAEQGEGFTFSDVGIMRTELLKEKDREVAAIIRLATNNGQFTLSGKAQDDLIARVDRKYEELINELPNLMQNNFLKDNLENVALLSQVQGWQVAPEISFYKAAWGDTIANLLVELQADVVNEGQFSLLVQKYPQLFATGGSQDPGNFLTNLSKRARAVIGGQQVDEKGNSTSTGNPVLDEQLDRVIILEGLNKAKQAGNKEGYQEFFGKISENNPEDSLAVVASDPAAFTMLSNDQKKSVGAQVNTLALNSAETLMDMGYSLRWVPKDEYIDSEVEGVFGEGRREFKRKKLGKQVTTEGVFVAERDPNLDSSVFTWDSDAQEALDTLNMYAVPIMQDGKWRQYTSPDGRFTNVGDWATQFATTSQIIRAERKLEEASAEFQKVEASTPAGVYAKATREREMKRLQGLVDRYTKELMSIEEELGVNTDE